MSGFQFAIVEFVVENFIEVIPITFLTDNDTHAYFPKKRHFPAKILSKNVPIKDYSVFNKWQVEIIYRHESYKQCRRYCKKLDEGVNSSALESEPEKRRRRRKPARVVSSSSDNDCTDEDDDANPNPISDPLKISHDESAQVTNVKTSFQAPAGSLFENSSTPHIISVEDISGVTAPNENQIFVNIIKSELQAFQKLVLKKLGRFELELRDVKKILLSEKNVSGSDDIVIPQLPVTSPEELHQLCTWISQSEVNFKKIVGVLALVGGSDGEDTVKRALFKTIDNDLAKQVTFYGTKDKPSFNKTTLYHVLKEAVRKNPLAAAVSDKVIESCCMKWFNGAGDRKGGRKSRKKNTEPANNNQ